jgi:hypothetical protein
MRIPKSPHFLFLDFSTLFWEFTKNSTHFAFSENGKTKTIGLNQQSPLGHWACSARLNGPVNNQRKRPTLTCGPRPSEAQRQGRRSGEQKLTAGGFSGETDYPGTLLTSSRTSATIFPHRYRTRACSSPKMADVGGSWRRTW